MVNTAGMINLHAHGDDAGVVNAAGVLPLPCLSSSEDHAVNIGEGGGEGVLIR